jgi:hypothetical protein
MEERSILKFVPKSVTPQERRLAVLNRNAVMETISGSGFHPNDPNSPQRSGKAPVSEWPVAILQNDKIFLYDDCAFKVKAYLERFLGEHPDSEIQGREPQMQWSVESAKEAVLLEAADGTAKMVFLQRDWNNIVWALNYMGLPVCMTDTRTKV